MKLKKDTWSPFFVESRSRFYRSCWHVAEQLGVNCNGYQRKVALWCAQLDRCRSFSLLCLVFRRVRKIPWSDYSFMSVRPSARNNSTLTGWIFMKFDIWVLLEDLYRKFKFHYNRTRLNGTLHEDQCTFLITSRSILLIIKNASDESCRENKNTHFMFNNYFIEIRAVYEIMWKDVVERVKP